MARPRRFYYISDIELVALAQLGSLEACDELVSRFRPGVVLVARQTLESPEAAQDVAQETFLLAFRALPQLQDPAKFAGWLHAIARNHARRVGVRLSRDPTSDLTTLEEKLTTQEGRQAVTPLETLLERERQDAVRALLASLSPECQTALNLFYYEQWPASRIAEFLSLPLTTIKWRLRYGRKQLHARLAALLQEDEPPQEHQTKEQPRKQQLKQPKEQPKEQGKFDGRTRSEERDTPHARPAGKDGRDGRACGADGQLRERHSELREAL